VVVVGCVCGGGGGRLRACVQARVPRNVVSEVVVTCLIQTLYMLSIGSHKIVPLPPICA
jgi:hypothetical protein